MKIKLCLIAFLFFSFGCNKEDEMRVNKDPNYVVLDGDIGHWHTSTILSADGNIIVVGSQIVDSTYHMVIHKMKPTGEIIYSKILPFGNVISMSVCEDSKQNIYITGYTYGEFQDEERYIHVVKLDNSGSVFWEKSYFELEEITPTNIEVDNDNEVVISGYKDKNNVLIFLKIDSLGQLIKFKEYDNDDNYYSPNDLLILKDGNYLSVGTTTENIELTWFDSDFNLQFLKSFGNRYSHCRSALELDNGDLVIVGHEAYVRNGGVVDSSKVKIFKTDSKGKLIWEKVAGNSKYSNDGQSIAINQDGSFIISGYAFESISLIPGIDHMLVYLDKNGNEINTRYFDDLETSRGQNIVKTQDDRNVITGMHRDGTFFLNVDNFGN